MSTASRESFRKTSQRLVPARRPESRGNSYDLYPAHPLNEGSIDLGFGELARRLAGHHSVRVDGYIGVFWRQFAEGLRQAFGDLGVRMAAIDVSSAQKSPAQIEEIVAPYLGGDDPLFGKRITKRLNDFFDADLLAQLRPDPTADCTVLLGCGAGLVDWEGPLVYVDLPKNELQFRSRAGAATNLFVETPQPPKPQYKRYYFVDWPLLNRHKADLLSQVDWLVDEQRPDEPTILAGGTLRDALKQMSHSVLRVRPWFEPGPWGGQWIKEHIPDLPEDVANYAWSFELIVPENGLLFSDGELLLEVSFDWLMFQQAPEVLGDCFIRFGHEFPIRFDFLDTFRGGNLSVQCHPRPEYIREQFGENFTQDETYYILDCEPDTEVFLGFVEGVDDAEFRRCLEESLERSTPVDVKRYVNAEPAHKHDLFLIPNGTIHCSGADNLVLEISATPYIFTFKMYDWLRKDLDGRPRPLNIEHAWRNLYFDRQGKRIENEFVSKPHVVEHGLDWRLVHLPTHAEHFYDVYRFEFDTAVDAVTAGSPHVLMLVEGSIVTVETKDGTRRQFHYAETFVIPAAAESYRLINEGPGRAFVVNALIKKL